MPRHLNVGLRRTHAVQQNRFSPRWAPWAVAHKRQKTTTAHNDARQRYGLSVPKGTARTSLASRPESHHQWRKCSAAKAA